MHVRGMRHVRTVRDLAAPARRATQAQVVAELARNEHEKARLERELGIWATNHDATGHRLQRVVDRIAELWTQLEAMGRPRSRKALASPV